MARKRSYTVTLILLNAFVIIDTLNVLLAIVLLVIY